MVDRNLKRNEIEVAQSRYRFPALREDAPTTHEPLLAQSISELGMITPLIVHEWKGEFHLVDGFKRMACAEQMGIDSIPCHVLPAETNLRALLEILVHEQREEMVANAARCARFLHLAVCIGLTEGDLIDHWLPILGFQGHPRILKQLRSVAALPEEVLRFCEEKHFSLKQCVHLTGHPRALLVQLFAWRKRLVMSASITEELLDHFDETLHIEQISIEELIRDPALVQILKVVCSPQERTQRIRTWIRARRFPMLTEIEKRMQKAQAKMKLPSHITVQWDSALERRELRFLVRLKEPREWSRTLEALNEEPVATGIRQLFEDL